MMFVIFADGVGSSASECALAFSQFYQQRLPTRVVVAPWRHRKECKEFSSNNHGEEGEENPVGHGSEEITDLDTQVEVEALHFLMHASTVRPGFKLPGDVMITKELLLTALSIMWTLIFIFREGW